MSIAELFIRRPVMTTLVMLGILLFGVLGYRELAVSDLPNVDFPTILVSATLPGANPDTMASAVATPLERQFSTIAGLDSMSSTNALGITQITLQFALDRNIDAAAQDVQTMISQTLGQLPQDMPSPPSYRKVNPADQPILYLSLGSPTLPLSTVDEYAETFIAQRISMVSGVAQVQVLGSQKYAVHMQADPKALATKGIGIDEVAAALRSGNVNLPTGALWGEHQAFTVQSNGQLYNAEAYRPLIVTYRNGSPVRLSDLGNVIDSVENDKIASWFNDREGIRRAIVLAVQRQPGTNTVDVVDNIRNLLPIFRAQIPPAVKLVVLYDRSVSIRNSVDDVKFTLLLTVFLVIMVIFLFLRNISATVIPSLALPMSIVGTFAVMYLLGFSLDNMSLMALTLSVGFVVDDAIVMLENIVRHMEHGEAPLEAALNGSKEIGFTIVSMTISLAAVFIPVLFMSGLLGRLLHEFAVTIGVAILVSGVVSLSLTPMLCSRFLRSPREQHHGRLYAASERFFASLLRGYDGTLRLVLRHRLAMLLFSIVLAVATGFLFVQIPKGFLPSEDTGQVFTFTEAVQGISYSSMVEHQMELARIVQAYPNVDSFNSSVGAGAGGVNATSNTGRIFMLLKPVSERQFAPSASYEWLRSHVGGMPGSGAILSAASSLLRHHVSADEIVEELRPKLMSVTGMRAFPQNLPTIRIGGQLTKSLYQITLQSPNTQELYENGQKFEDNVRALPQVQDVTSDLQIKNPQVNVVVDRDRASALGLSAQQVEDALSSAYSQRQVSTIYAPNNQYRVLLELLPRYQEDPAALSMLYVRSSRGNLVPLDTVAGLSNNLGPLLVNHLGQLPAVTVSFNLRPGYSLGQAVDAVNKLARNSLPSTITTNFQGTAQAFESSFRGLGVLLLMAILVIYLVLGVLYESFIHPITILSGLPSAGFGALVTLMIFHVDLNVYAFVGVIMLVGIVKKNAIMMIDFALEAQRVEGKSPFDAIYQGCLVRFRPIMMTTMAALMGTLPIALGVGAGAESRRPLGLAVVGGLLISQFVTLYLTPVVYLYLESLQQWLGGRFGKRREAAGEPSLPTPRHVAGDLSQAD
jgi:hydrophobic/amphiphilic exporter-1 (mainly G- bacteria), HAE1 family